MDALFSERIKPWTSSLLRQDALIAEQNRLEHGHHHGWAMDVLFSEWMRSWKLSRFMHGCAAASDGACVGTTVIIDVFCMAPIDKTVNTDITGMLDLRAIARV